MPRRRRRSPFRWLFGPASGAVKGRLHAPEWLRVAAVLALMPLLDAAAAHASDYFTNPLVASAVAGALVALSHRLHDGTEPKEPDHA